METPPGSWDMKLMGAVDARAIVPVADPHGGLTIYYRGRPTHYLLAGEWYLALPADTASASSDGPTGDGVGDPLTTRN